MRHRHRDKSSFSSSTRTVSDVWVREDDGVILHSSSDSSEGANLEKTESSTIDDIVAFRMFKSFKAIPRVKGQPHIRFRDTKVKKLDRSVHPCTHSSVTANLDGINTIIFSAHVFGQERTRTVAGGSGFVVQECGGLPASIIPVLGSANTPASIDWAALNAKFDEASDQFMRTSFLVGEDIVEFEVFKEAALILLNPSHAVKTFVKKVGPLLKGLLRPTMRDAHAAAKFAGNSYLSYQFGVAPAIKDVQDALKASTRVKKRMEYLIANKGQFVKVRAKQQKKLPNTVGLLGSDRCQIYTTYSGHSWNTGVISSEGRVRNDLNHGNTWVAFAQYFGVQHIVGLAWELIPFSFVVDWVTNAQERLRSLTRLKLGGPYSEFRNLSFSLKSTAEFDVMVDPGYHPFLSGFHTTFDEPQRVGSGYISLYNRWLTSPDDSAVFDFSNLGIFHVLATGSLIVQRT